MHLTTDPAEINAVVNHPAVRPSCGLPEMGELDFSALIARPENWFLKGEHGGFMLLWSGPRVREVHVFILPEGRGRWGFDAAQETAQFAWGHGCKLIWARVAVDHRALALFATFAGMRDTGETIETLGETYRIYSLEAPSCLPQ